MGRGKPSRTGGVHGEGAGSQAARGTVRTGGAIRLDEGNIVWLDGER